MDQDLDDLLRGQRPGNIPAHWIGSPTASSEDFRWDDPENPGNSVRIFRGNSADKNPARRVPFVIVVNDGQVLGRNGEPVTDEVAKAEALSYV